MPQYWVTVQRTRSETIAFRVEAKTEVDAWIRAPDLATNAEPDEWTSGEPGEIEVTEVQLQED